MARALVVALVLALVSQPVFAETAFRRTMREAATAEALAAAQTATRGPNPYLVPGLVLVGAGSLLAVMGFVFPTGGECSDNSTLTRISVSCNTTANKGLVFTGLAAAGTGGVLLMRGERRRNAPAPALVPTPGGLALVNRISF